jgi:TRAP-type C4-dicarboxylate transport system substrate-binding protein
MKISRITVFFLVAALMTGLVLFSSALAAEKAIKVKILASWGTEQSNVREFVVPMVDKLNKRSGGRLEVSWVGPEAVPSFEQFKPLSKGLFDFLYTTPSYHMGEVSLGLGMDTFYASPKERRDAGFLQILDEAYKKFNVRVQGLNALGVGYIYQLKKDLTKADFTGLKIRTTPSYEPMVIALGGSPIRIASSELYSALEKGVIDGCAQTAFGPLDLRLYEVAKYQLRPMYGEVVQPFLSNIDSWNKLPKDLQDLITRTTMETEEESRKTLIVQLQKDDAELVRLGMKFSNLPLQEGEKLQRAFYERSWDELVLKYSPDIGPKLKKAVENFLKTRKKS